MILRPLVRLMLLVSLGATGLGLAGCGGDDAPPTGTFAPLHFDYLTKLRLNVGSIAIQDHSAPLGPDDVSQQSPVTPAQALIQMAHDRLFAAALLGSATFVIDQASIVRGAGGGLYGNMAVHLEVTTAGGARAGYAEARVARQHLPGSEEENLQTVLYTMTKQMIDSMNVELEFQLKRTMGDFLTTGTDVPQPVTAVPLTGATPPPPPVPGQMLPPATQTEPLPPGAEQDPGMTMSPPPGYLQLPQGQE